MDLVKIGVFDSGIGGRAVAESIARELPQAELTVIDDHENVPYGSKTAEHIRRLTDAALQPLIGVCDVIVIACNSATAAAIEYLRETYPEQLFIGLEPMVKPACILSSSGVVAICATPATLTSERYKRLKHTYAGETIVIEPDCSTWASMIEHDQLDELIIRTAITDACDQGADIIVLACTHYHWIRETIERACTGRATVLDPSSAIVKRIKTVLELS